MRKFFTLITAIVLSAGAYAQGGFVDRVVNGNCEGDDNSCFFAHEWIDGEYVEDNARLVADPTNASNKCIEVVSRDDPGNLVDNEGNPKAIDDWDSQFFIYVAEKLEVGDEYTVSFKVRADKAATGQTQAHDNPGNYIHWSMIGDIEFTDEWMDITRTGTVTADQAPAGRELHTIAFNLAVLKEANKYYFDDIEWSVKKAEPVNYDDYINLITNGNCEGSDVSNFKSNDWFTGESVWGDARIVADPTDANNKCIEVVSRDDPGNLVDNEGNPKAIDDWDAQFFITVADQLVQGDKYRVKFRVRADKAASAQTQSHDQPGGYIHWAFIGDVPFTTEWVEIERTGTITAEQAPADRELHTIAFNLAVLKEANNYYFDDISFEVLKVTPPDPDEFEDLITNGNCEGEETTNFTSKEWTTEEQYWGPSRLVADPTDASNKCIEVVSRDDPGNLVDDKGNPKAIDDWDSQFFITVADKLEVGDQYQVSFRVRAEKDATAQTQSHNQPGGYIHWAFIGDVAFTTEWKEITRTGTISAEQAPEGNELHTIAFNLAVLKEANKYYFDDISFKVKKANVEPEPLIGDANGDGEVNITDVTVAVDYVLSNNPELIVMKNADVNGDGEVNITDITGIVNIVLGNKQ
ncbi:MAG: dockerin type I repeat-containing protein [Prevotella sp.]|nr:dockerin type I repeat-containing protein [Prevotella sp.]